MEVNGCFHCSLHTRSNWNSDVLNRCLGKNICSQSSHNSQISCKEYRKKWNTLMRGICVNVMIPNYNYCTCAHTHLRDYGGLVDVLAVAPPIHTALLLQVSEVDVPPRNISLSREISDHFQPVSAASAQLLFPIHHLTVTMTQTLLV